jgi:hypothetical protein
MHLRLNDKLVLQSIGASTAVGYSKEFDITMPDNIAEVVLLVIFANGTGASLDVFLEETNDTQNWKPLMSLLDAAAVTGGIAAAPTVKLSAQRYRIRWEFSVSEGSGTCVVAATITTSHG